MSVCVKEKKAKYYLNPSGEFVIENYNFSKPFANFFTGIAGKYGIPMWVFYVNRGQAIASFGIKDKDHCMVEFFPANKAWQLTPLQGFRTFLKIQNAKNPSFYEPFHNGFANRGQELINSLSIGPSDLKIKEQNLSMGLETTVEYFTIPNDSYAALARTVTIKNTAKSAKKIQILDGLPQIIPYGTSNLFLKKLGRTIEAWMDIKNLSRGVPFYKLDVDPTDRPEVLHIKEGNFFLGFSHTNGKAQIHKPIVDPQAIFGPVTDFSCPHEFLIQKNFRYPKEQLAKNKTPCGFLLLDTQLSSNKQITFHCLIGYMRSLEMLNSSISRITKPGYLAGKQKENQKIIADLQEDIATKSSSPEFDLYARQTYLDNIMRGGYPVILKSKSHNSVFYLYSRKHGDLERDYNKFQIQPTYFSQGNGNYRDVNQNRRCDIWFNPQIKDENIITFFNLLQADGFNPLVVKGLSFQLNDPELIRAEIEKMLPKEEACRLIAFLSKPFTPGELLLFIEDTGIKLNKSYDEFLSQIISKARPNYEAEHAEGFWTDHWTYNLDLLESYIRLYPENLKELFFEKKVFTFFDNAEVVRPRQEKYVLREGLIKQLHSVATDSAKKEMIKKRTIHPHTVRAGYGNGEIYHTTLINKLLCLFANKLSSLDPFGVGIEMEADKPNWFDALNGLPALFGSSVCETFELKRLALMIKAALERGGKIEKIYVTDEIKQFLSELDGLIRKYFKSDSENKDFDCWDRSYTLREEYRSRVRFGFDGKESEISTAELTAILNNAIVKIDLGIDKAFNKKRQVFTAYFINEVAEYEAIKEHYVKPTKFRQKKLPPFLESQMHALRITSDVKQARLLYAGTRNSPLYDKKLKMYKVTSSLKGMPEEIGRCRVFTPGWLEHESIWLHMEYKYLLELLHSGLYEEFYADFKNALIPFQPPERYGRNILENSSFLVSSAFPDKRLHGNGFVARLSGSTAEFLNIWLVMNVGRNPFIIEDGKLILKFSPILAGWLFSKKEKTYSFNFLGKIRITYHNPKRENTFGKNAVKPNRIVFKDRDEKPVEIISDTIPHPYAQAIRALEIKQIDIYLE